MIKLNGIITKIELIEFLNSINIDENIINKINEFPDFLNIDNDNYDLYINITPIDTKSNQFNYELNYYSYNNSEFLFTPKVFSNIEISIYTLFYYLNNV